jgi:RNA polymerase sigma-70 factor, ECF subfamily
MTDSRDVDPSSVETLLERWSQGEKQAYDQLLTHLYRDIHAIAVRHLHGERYATIRPAALVHEVYLRLGELSQMRWQDRAHFLSMAARVTRQALVDEARRRRSGKRDGGNPVTLSDENLGAKGSGYDALDVDALLSELQQFDDTAAAVLVARLACARAPQSVSESPTQRQPAISRTVSTTTSGLSR